MRDISADIINNRYPSLRIYDSIQQTLPPEKRSAGIRRSFERKSLQWKESYPEGYQNIIREKFFHSLPTAMFVLLPLFAVFLKWLNRKERFYVSHVIFSLHFHCFVFITVMIFMLLGRLLNIAEPEQYGYWLSYAYLIIAIRHFYHQSWIRAFLKSILVSILYGLALLIVLAGLAVIIFFNI